MVNQSLDSINAMSAHVTKKDYITSYIHTIKLFETLLSEEQPYENASVCSMYPVEAKGLDDEKKIEKSKTVN